MVGLVFVVFQDRAVFIQVQQIVGRQERDFPAAARGIDHEMRNGHAAGMALKRLDDLQAGLHRRAEVVGPLGQVGLIQIIRLHAGQQELLHEPFHDFRIIVHPFQQHRLRPQRHTGVGQAPAGRFDLRGEFIGMIEMQVHIDRMILFDDLAQFRGNALGQRPGHAGTEPDEFEMRDGPERLQNTFDQVIG